MSLEKNRQTVLAYVEAFNAHDVPRLRTLFTEDAVIHGVTGFGPLDKALTVWHTLHHGMKCQLIVDGIAAMEWFEMKGGRIHRRWGARDSAAMSRMVGM